MNIDELKAQKSKLEQEIKAATAAAALAADPRRKAALDTVLQEQATLRAAEVALESQRAKVAAALETLQQVGGKGPYDLGDGVAGGYTLRSFVGGGLGFAKAIRGPRKPKTVTEGGKEDSSESDESDSDE